MKSKDQILLEEAYFDIFSFQNTKSLQEFIKNDQHLIDELIQEGFGDYFKQMGGAIKGGVQRAATKIKETLSSGLATAIVKSIVAAVPKQELENLANIIAKGQIPKEKISQVQGILAAQQSTNEGYDSDKALLASMLFTEDNIERALQSSGLLTEARSGEELQKFAKEVAAKINQLYPKNKKAMAAAIPKFSNSVSKYLGITPTTTTSSTAQSTAPQTNSAQSTAPQTSMDKVKGVVNNAVNSIENKIPTGKGLVNKITGFIKAHPKISAAAAATLLGIVVAAFAGSAPVVAPALIAAMKGAGIAGTTSIVKQMISGEKVDLKQAGKAAAIGGALGGVGGVIAAGLGNIASAVMGSSGSSVAAAGTSNGNSSQSSNNTSKSWTSPDAAEYDQGESVPSYTKQEGLQRAREIAQQMGVDPRTAEVQYNGYVPTSINGQSVEGFLTNDEKTVVNFAKNVAKELGVK